MGTALTSRSIGGHKLTVCTTPSLEPYANMDISEEWTKNRLPFVGSARGGRTINQGLKPLFLRLGIHGDRQSEIALI